MVRSSTHIKGCRARTLYSGSSQGQAQWAPMSWGRNHPLYVRAQIDHGLQVAQYGYWGFSPSNKPEGGYQAFGQLLALAKPPTAIFASNDLMAIGGICAASARGVRVPDQLSVLGYDDIALASFTTPPLTTVAQPKYEMGELTARLLLERVAGQGQPLRRELLHTKLIVRQSTAPLT